MRKFITVYLIFISLLGHAQSHLADMTTLAISPNGKYVISSAVDKVTKVWNASTGVLLHSYETEEVFKVYFSPSGNKAMLFANMNNCYLLDLISFNISESFDRSGIIDFYDEGYLIKHLYSDDKSYSKISIVNFDNLESEIWSYQEKRKEGEPGLKYGGVDSRGRFLVVSLKKGYIFHIDDQMPITEFPFKPETFSEFLLSKDGNSFVCTSSHNGYSISGEEIWNDVDFELKKTSRCLKAHENGLNLYDSENYFKIIDFENGVVLKYIKLSPDKTFEVSFIDIDKAGEKVVFEEKLTGIISLLDVSQGRVLPINFIDEKEAEKLLGPKAKRQRYNRDVDSSYELINSKSGLDFYKKYGGESGDLLFVGIKNQRVQNLTIDMEITIYRASMEPLKIYKEVRLKPEEFLESKDLILNTGVSNDKVLFVQFTRLEIRQEKEIGIK